MSDQHHGTIRSERGSYAEFIDELFRLGMIEQPQRDLFRQSLGRLGDASHSGIVPPTSRGLPHPGFAAARRAEDAGLVRSTDNGLHVGCGAETVHWGYLWGAAEPVAVVRPGETITIDTVSHEGLMADQGDPYGFFTRAGMPPESVLSQAVDIYARVQHSGLGPHIVSGPIWIEGAEPGDTLAVHVLDVQPLTPYGVNSMRTGKGGLPEDFTLNRSLVIPLDLERRIAHFSPRIQVPMAPFFGIMATGPARSLGRTSSVPPGPYGGNIDLKDLTAGSILYLPVHVPGALFMVGDGHAAQGDGEVDLTAIETSMTGRFRFELCRGKTLAWPRAETPTHWIALGLHTDLEEAMRMAIRETVGFLVETQSLTREDAYALASIAVDFEVTQVVDGVKGIHAMIPKAIFV
jgi:acetamidase/formamidase